MIGVLRSWLFWEILDKQLILETYPKTCRVKVFVSSFCTSVRQNVCGTECKECAWWFSQNCRPSTTLVRVYPFFRRVSVRHYWVPSLGKHDTMCIYYCEWYMMLLCISYCFMINAFANRSSYSHSDQQNTCRSITLKSLKFCLQGSKASHIHGFRVIWVCVGERLDFQTSVFRVWWVMLCWLFCFHPHVSRHYGLNSPKRVPGIQTRWGSFQKKKTHTQNP